MFPRNICSKLMSLNQLVEGKRVVDKGRFVSKREKNVESADCGVCDIYIDPGCYQLDLNICGGILPRMFCFPYEGVYIGDDGEISDAVFQGEPVISKK